MTTVNNRLISGSILRFITLIVATIISFFIMPFMINSLGDHLYGIWVLVASTLSFYGFLDLGLSGATQRYISYSLARNDEKELKITSSTSIFLFFILACIGLLLTVIISFFMNYIVSDADDANLLKVIILIMGSSLSISFPFYAYSGVLTAYLRFDLLSYIQLIKNIYRAALIIIVLSVSPSIIYLVFVVVSADLFSNLLLMICAYRNADWLEVKWKYVSKAKMNVLFNYGFFGFMSFVATQLRFRSDNFVIAAFLPFSSVTHFKIGAQLAEHFLNIQSSLLGVMMPKFTADISRNDDDSLVSSFLFVNRVSAISATLLGGAIIIFGQSFIILWVGETFSAAYVPMVILIVGMIIAGVQYPSVQLFYALAKHRFFAFMSLGEGVINIALSIFLVQKMGIIGVALGTMIPIVLIKFFVQPFYACKIIGLSKLSYVKSTFLPMVLATILQIPIWMIVRFYPTKSFFDIIAYGILIYPLLAFILFLLIFSQEDRLIIYNKLLSVVKKVLK